ncbi:MAG: T9SS type A sorting domain-containing protein [Flavobacteriales bacterium]|nr:T9SS type A sorting domain-containing protein [Flavobacteriales bacterium]
MKRMIFGLLMVLMSCTDIAAQTYFPLFGDTTRMWTSTISGSAEGDCLDTWVTTHWIDGDTLIDGDAYTRVRSRERHYVSPLIDWCQSVTEYPGQDTYVRELGHAVFARSNWSTESLIYDFDAVVGDTIPYPINAYENGFGWHAIVVQVDSILVNGTYRIRQTVSDGPNEGDTIRVIEGIGATSAPFGMLSQQLGLSHFGQLDCVREFGQVIFGDSWCELITGVPSSYIRPLAPPYPNPATDNVILDDRISKFHVLDTHGRIVLHGNGHKAVVRGFATGAYLVRGWDRQGMLVGSWTIVVQP